MCINYLKCVYGVKYTSHVYFYYITYGWIYTLEDIPLSGVFICNSCEGRQQDIDYTDHKDTTNDQFIETFASTIR